MRGWPWLGLGLPKMSEMIMMLLVAKQGEGYLGCAALYKLKAGKTSEQN